MIKLECNECNSIFTRPEIYNKSTNKKVFCSRYCRISHYKKRRKAAKIPIYCDVCSKQFYRNIKQVSDNNNYCSTKCKKVSRKKYTLICDYCHNSFKSANKNKKYCNNFCYSNSRKKEQVYKICVTCNKDFKTHRSSNRKYCSKKCKNKSAISVEKRKCLFCNNEFIVEHRSLKYCCSSECRSNYSRMQKYGEDSFIICKGCGKKVYLDKKMKTLNYENYCSKECLLKKGAVEFGLA